VFLPFYTHIFWADLGLFAAKTLAVVFILSAIRALFARLRIEQMVNFLLEGAHPARRPADDHRSFRQGSVHTMIVGKMFSFYSRNAREKAGHRPLPLRADADARRLPRQAQVHPGALHRVQYLRPGMPVQGDRNRKKFPRPEKKFQAYVYLDRCIYCGQCVDSCPKEALACTHDFRARGHAAGQAAGGHLILDA